MEKKEFQEMVVINKALGGKYALVLDKIRTALGFSEEAKSAAEAPEEFIDPQKLKAEIEKKILQPVEKYFTPDNTTEDINDRDLPKAQIIQHIEDTVNSCDKTIEVQNVFQKIAGKEPETLEINHPTVVFLTTFINKLKGDLISYRDFCDTMLEHKKTFVDELENYVDQLKEDKKVWRKYYKPLDKLEEVKYEALIKKIKNEYRNEYHLNEKDYTESLKKWLVEVSSSMNNIKGGEGTHPFDKAGIVYSKFSTLLKNNFNSKLDKSYAVFGQLRAILLNDFFNACVKEQKGEKLSLGTMAAYIQKKMPDCKLPAYQEDYSKITDDLYLYKELSKINFEEDILLASLDKTDAEYYMNDTAKGGLKEVFDNFMEKVPATVNIWKNAIVSGIKEINIDGLPKPAEILDELKNLTATYSESAEFPANKLYDLIYDIHSNNVDEAFSFDIHTHCDLTYKAVDSAKLLLQKDQEKITQKWWDLLNGNVKDESADSLAVSARLLPAPQRVVSCITNNVQKGISPAKLDQQIQAWGASVKGAISQAVIGVDGKNVKISGKAFKKHLEAIFASANLATILNRINFIIPDDNILVASDDGNSKTIQTIWQEAVSQKHLIDYVTASGGQPGMLFLELYNDGRIEDLKSLCDSPYLLLPSKDDIALAVYRTLKGKPATLQQQVNQLQKKVVDLSAIQDIHTLQNELLEEAIKLERAYKTFANQAVHWMQNAENATLVYGKAHKDYSNSVDSCSKAAKKNADAWNAAVGNIALVGGVALAVWATPMAAVTATIGRLTLTLIPAIAEGALVNAAVGTAAKQVSQVLFKEAETFYKNADTPLDFYIKMKQGFNTNVLSFGKQINSILESLEKAIGNLNRYSTTKEVAPDILDNAKHVFKSIVDELNICHKQLHGATTAFINKTNGLVIKDATKAQNSMELNLYRDFISNNFEVDSGTDWNTICQATYFLKRLRTLKVVTDSSHFIDNGTCIGLDFWPDRGWGAEMKNLIDFSKENQTDPFS